MNGIFIIRHKWLLSRIKEALFCKYSGQIREDQSLVSHSINIFKSFNIFFHKKKKITKLNYLALIYIYICKYACQLNEPV